MTDRVFKSAFFSLIFNIVYGLYHIIFGVKIGSWWLFTIGIYYAILSVIRFAALLNKNENLFITKFAGIMLMILSLPLVSTVILTVARDRGAVLHEIIMIAMAAYVFAKTAVAAVNLIRARKRCSAKLRTLRNISFADALVSVFSLQRSMLVSFEGMTNDEICIMNLVIGSAVCVTVFMLGLNLVLKNGLSHLARPKKSEKQ